ncbi:MAG: hypothetical protein JF606_13815 [Burkholderiales bacterium]|jgi:hypothetical protein|nr:hypothetical protein [Burkholderiales bacterium]
MGIPTLRTDNLCGEALKVLLVGSGNEPRDSLIVFNSVEGLTPQDVCSCRVGLEFEREDEW